MHILITGGQGYIGTHLAKALLSAGHTVTTLDNGFNSKHIDCGNHNGRLIRHQASVANPDAVGRALQGIDLVYHLAARHDWDASPRHPLRLVETNVQGTATVLTMARKVGIDRVIIASDAAVYGNIVGATPTDPCVPVSMYGASKLAAEAVCRGFHQAGLDIVLLRFYNVYGKGSESVVDKFCNGASVIYDDGDQTRDFVYIDDAVKALINAINFDPNIYNVATGEEVTINGLWQMLRPGETPTYKPAPQAEIYRSCGDISMTPWQPEILLSAQSGEHIRQLCAA